MYDPWVVDGFLSILDALEKAESEEMKSTRHDSAWAYSLAPDQLEVISATTAEDREFSELRRELPKSVSAIQAAEALFRHVRRIVPAVSAGFFMSDAGTTELIAVSSVGSASAILQDLRIQVGDRISGWALAHRQTVQNSNAALELGPVVRTFAVPLRYAVAVPLLSGQSAPLGVVTFYGADPFSNDHLRMLESAATLFASALAGLPAEKSESDQPATQSAGSTPRVH
jgi:hypothetical protein